MSRRLARHFRTMEAIRTATLEELVVVDGIGAEKAPVIIEELRTLAPVIDKLIAAGVNMTEPGVIDADSAEAADLPLVGKVVCVSGSVPGLSRTEAQEAVERLGGKSSSSVSKRTDILVAGDGAGSKLAKAEQLGVTPGVPRTAHLSAQQRQGLPNRKVGEAL
jgi:DNA ligase (NAD+)